MKAVKLYKRVLLTGLNAAQNLMPQLLGMLLSLLVIRLISPGLWGTLVSIQLWVFLLAHLASWGNKQYLLLNFSRQPAYISKLWSENFSSRLPLLFMGLLLFLLPLEFHLKLLGIPWLITRFVLQSFDAAIIFFRKFRFALITDVLLHAALFIFLSLNAEIVTIGHLLSSLLLLDMLKVVVFSIQFRKMVRSFHFHFNRIELKASLPFFLLGFTGLLQSRVDLLLVTLMLAPSEISVYQVYLSFVFLLFSIPNFIILPFAKNFYRLKPVKFKSLGKFLTLVAIPVLPAGIAVIWFILNYIYHIRLSLPLLILGVLFVLPVFYYSSIIHLLFRLKEEKKVVWLNLAGMMVNLTAGLVFIPYWGMEGALLAAVISQWTILSGYVFINRGLNKQEEKPDLTRAYLSKL